jgi:hypothetical protein
MRLARKSADAAGKGISGAALCRVCLLALRPRILISQRRANVRSAQETALAGTKPERYVSGREAAICCRFVPPLHTITIGAILSHNCLGGSLRRFQGCKAATPNHRRSRFSQALTGILKTTMTYGACTSKERVLTAVDSK